MSSQERYTTPLAELESTIRTEFDTVFSWEYEQQRPALAKLYAKGKQQQWDAAERIDWSLELDPANPMQLPDASNPLFGTRIWERMTETERIETRLHAQAWQLSQFMHGEQGALICTAKIVQTVPDADSKFYAATQVMDEARHVEAYARLLHEKVGLIYPMSPPLQTLLDQVIADSRWDMTYLGMQILIEGLALAAFANIRDHSANRLAAQVNAYVMQDEARHVAFGRLALRDFYPQLGESERDEREEFAVEACYLMRDRFLAGQVFERLGLPLQECLEHAENSELLRVFRARLFARIVPAMKEIGLWGPRIRKAYEDMELLEYANVDLEALTRDDELKGEQFGGPLQPAPCCDPAA